MEDLELQAEQVEQVKLPIVSRQLPNQPTVEQPMPVGLQPPGQRQLAIATPALQCMFDSDNWGYREYTHTYTQRKQQVQNNSRNHL